MSFPARCPTPRQTAELWYTFIHGENVDVRKERNMKRMMHGPVAGWGTRVNTGDNAGSVARGGVSGTPGTTLFSR